MFLLFWLLVVALQWHSGAYRAEFGGHSDEAAHFITGLMVRDYLAQGCPAPPMKYAENYYLHYPKIGFGHWPPLFPLLEAAWTLIFPVSRASLMVLMSLISAALAMTLYATVRREFSAGAGVAAGVVLLSLPIVQWDSRVVMTDSLVVLLVFWAMLAWARYLDEDRRRDAVWFGVLASLAGLAKGSGFLLALVPVFSVLLTRKFRLFTRFSTWLAALIVVAVCGPWYLFAPGAEHQAALPSGPLAHHLTAGVFLNDWRYFLIVFGIALAPLVAAGLWTRVSRVIRQRGAPTGLWAAAAALVAALPAFSLVISPARGYRHFSLIVPPVVLFLVAGTGWLFRHRPLLRLGRRSQAAAVTVAVTALFLYEAHAMPPAPARGFAQAAEQILAQPRFARSVLLVCSDSRGEGMFIAEIARRERRPGHIVLRASKMLSASNWFGGAYRLKYRTPAQLMAFLESVPVKLVVLDATMHRRRFPDDDLMERTIRTYPRSWKRLGRYTPRGSATGAGSGIDVYQLIERGIHPRGVITIDLRHSLGKIFRKRILPSP